MKIRFRDATPDDARALLAIYAPIVEHTAISFEIVAPDEAQMADRIRGLLATHAWIVAERDGGILGYAYATPHRERAAYRFAVETSVYVAEAARGTGLGRRLYEALFPRLAARGYHLALAGIALPNDASIALHRAVGFSPVGIYRGIGWKFGAWHDVSWWERRLRDDHPEPDAAAPGPAAAGHPEPGKKP